MSIPQKELEEWANALFGAEKLIARVLRGIEGPDAEELTGLLEDARRRVVLVTQGLARADDGPSLAPLREAPETPLELLDTPASRRYLEALREAWEARREVDRERRLTGGPAALLESWLHEAELDVYGPSGNGESAGH